MKRIVLLLALAPFEVWPQTPPPDPMSLKDAVGIALTTHKAIESSGTAVRAAETRIAQARSGNLPRVDYSESWTRSDNPVFVFSSLLTQHQFGPVNFQIGPLNRPDFLNNFQSQLTAEQKLYDGGRTKIAIHSAELGRDLAREDSRRTRLETIAAVVRAYQDALLAVEQVRATAQALRSAQADLDRAISIRDAGMSTDADVLSIRVHLAGVQELGIRREADLSVARAALNDAIGLPLDTAHTLTTTLSALRLPDVKASAYEDHAVGERPELRQMKLGVALAQNQNAAAKSALLPEVSAHAAFEADRQRFYDRGGANWLISIGLRWNLFDGHANRSRIAESSLVAQKAEIDQARANSAIRLQVRRAYADLLAADQRIVVAKASIAQAEESLRITQDRYQAGLGNITDLLRTETALLETRTRHLAAIHDQRVAAAMLELAAGTLAPESEILNEGTK